MNESKDALVIFFITKRKPTLIDPDKIGFQLDFHMKFEALIQYWNPKTKSHHFLTKHVYFSTKGKYIKKKAHRPFPPTSFTILNISL